MNQIATNYNKNKTT